MDVERYIGIPWAEDGHTFDGCSCWGLVQLFFYVEHQVVLPDLRTEPVEKIDWVAVEPGHEQTGDVALFRSAPMDRHVGVVVGTGKMLHVETHRASCVERFTGMRWKHRLLRIYRYRRPA